MARTATKSRQNKNGRTDFVAHGSDGHANMLRLRKATKNDPEELTFEGWTLYDFTQYGPHATERFLKAILIQRVNELNATPVPPQSDDRTKQGYAPRMWNPDELRNQSVAQSEIDEAIRTLKRAGLV